MEIEKIEKILNRLKENTKTDIIRIKTKLSNKRLSLTASKFGGFPYWIDPDTYPRSKNGTWLTLLAQINMKDLPKNDVFPDKGILQFFLLNGDYPTEWKVVFHKDVKEDIKLSSNAKPKLFTENGILKVKFDSDKPLEYIPFMPTSLMPQEVKRINKDGTIKIIPNLFWGESGFPVSGELALKFSSAYDFINMCDNNFEEELKKIAKELNINLPEIINYGFGLFPKDISIDATDILEDFNDSGHKIFGHPYFIQGDNRSNNNDLLLLQMDSNFAYTETDTGETDEHNNIMFGDTGICRFFISQEDLKNMDFSKVDFNWDCC